MCTVVGVGVVGQNRYDSGETKTNVRKTGLMFFRGGSGSVGWVGCGGGWWVRMGFRKCLAKLSEISWKFTGIVGVSGIFEVVYRSTQQYNKILMYSFHQNDPKSCLINTVVVTTHIVTTHIINPFGVSG